jgi:hypothetical protein
LFRYPSSYCPRAGVGDHETQFAQPSCAPPLPHHLHSFGRRRHQLSITVTRYNVTRYRAAGKGRDLLHLGKAGEAGFCPNGIRSGRRIDQIDTC